MDKLITLLTRFCWWLEGLVQKMKPTMRHECYEHGQGPIRTYRVTGKQCVYCQPEPVPVIEHYDLINNNGFTYIRPARNEHSQD